MSKAPSCACQELAGLTRAQRDQREKREKREKEATNFLTGSLVSVNALLGKHVESINNVTVQTYALL